MTTHRYETDLRWTGSTFDHAAYDRRHGVRLASGWQDLSADPDFQGDADLPNPEQLLVAAASSCQMLSFLALASRSGVEVLRYDDHAEGVMPADDPPVRLTRILLQPRIVARSLTSDVVLEPRVEVAA